MSKINVFITVDTEHSIGGAFQNPNLKPVGKERRIYGRIGNKFYGIPLIMDIADRYGIRLTFFVEIFNKYYFGENESRNVCEYILRRNHDIQLHLHPNYLNFTLPKPCKISFSDLIGEYSLSKQVEFLEEATATLIEFGVNRPIAFRSGSFGANILTLKALRKTGFLIDSSYNAAFLGKCCLLPNVKINDLISWEGIWEFPITSFLESTALRHKRYMALDLNGVSFKEIKWVMHSAISYGPRNITIILHCFNFIKNYDLQYLRSRPRNIVIKRFEMLCRYFAENSDTFQVMPFGSLNENYLKCMAEESIHILPKAPPILSILRGLEQVYDTIV